MITDLNKILNEWAFRTKSGKPNPKSMSHQIILENILKEFGWNQKARIELLNSPSFLIEKDIVKNKKQYGKKKSKKKGTRFVAEMKKDLKTKSQAT